ncbi:MAG: hypothetical protein ACE5JR_03030 [Gemmatimonadota bacterium]
MSRPSPITVRTLLLLMVAAAVGLAGCHESPPTQPPTEDVPGPQFGGGPPTRMVNVQVNLLDAPGGSPVAGTWVVSFLSAADGNNDIFDVTSDGSAVLDIAAPAAGCIVARPVNTESDPALIGGVPPFVPPVGGVELELTEPGPRGAVVTWLNPDADHALTSAPAWRPFLVDGCVNHPSITFDRNDGNGPDPDAVITLVPPLGTAFDVLFRAPGSNSSTTGMTLSPDGYLLVPLCDGAPAGSLNQVPGWRPGGLDDDQHVAVLIGANPGNAAVPLIIGDKDGLTVPADACTLPSFVVEQELVADGNGAFFTGTLELAGLPAGDPPPVSATYTMCAVDGQFEAPDDGDPNKIELRGDPPDVMASDPEVKFGYQAHLAATASNPQDIVLTADPWAFVAWWFHVGSEGDATFRVRNRNASTTLNLEMPYSCPPDDSAGECTTDPSRWSGSLAAVAGFNAVLSSKLQPNGFEDGRPVWKVLVSATGLPHETVQIALSTAGDGWPESAKAHGKKPKITSAFVQLSVPNSCALTTNDGRWSTR